ncbi:MAG: hypothetical protein PUC71_09390 [Oscillospiraceae bacterium]|nr:hypothetical protein [Oscillospiraceae bacterium]
MLHSNPSVREIRIPQWSCILLLILAVLSRAVILFGLTVHTFSYDISYRLLVFTAADFFPAEVTAASLLLIEAIAYLLLFRGLGDHASSLSRGTEICNAVLTVLSVSVLGVCDAQNVRFPYPALAVLPFVFLLVSLAFLLTDGIRWQRESGVLHLSRHRRPVHIVRGSALNRAEREKAPGPTFSAEVRPGSRVTAQVPKTPRRAAHAKDHSQKRKSRIASQPSTASGEYATGKKPHSNEVEGTLFQAPDASFQEQGNLLDQILGGRPEEHEKENKKTGQTFEPEHPNPSRRAYLEEFSDYKPQSSGHNSLYSKRPPRTAKLTSEDASHALHAHTGTSVTVSEDQIIHRKKRSSGAPQKSKN